MASSIPTTAPLNPVLNLKARLDAVEAHLAPLLAAPLSETVGRLSIMERCQLELLLAYSVNTTFFIYLKTQGVDPNEHPVMKELERVKQYVEKVKKASGASKAPTSVDRDAAARFIKHALASNPKEDKEDEVLTVASDDDEEDKVKVEQETKPPVQATESKAAGTQKRRMDPFAGYTDNTSKDEPSNKKKKNKREN